MSIHLNGDRLGSGCEYTAAHYFIGESLSIPNTGSPDLIALNAAGGVYPWGSVTPQECRAALDDGLRRGWFRVHDAGSIAATRADLEASGLIGPVYGFDAEPGYVDFTPVGAELHSREDAARIAQLPGPVEDFVYASASEFAVDAYYPNAKIAELRRTDFLDRWPGTVASDPVPCGPYRIAWWLTVPQGVRIRYRTTAQGSGSCGGFGSRRCIVSDRWKTEPDRLRDVLKSHGLGFAEWAVLYQLSAMGPYAADLIRRQTVRLCRWRYGRVLTDDDCRPALEWCRSRGLIIPVGDLDDGPVLAEAVSAIDLRPVSRTLRNLDHLELSPAGSAYVLAVLYDFLGPNWTDNIVAEIEIYRRERRYFRTAEAMEALFRISVPAPRTPEGTAAHYGSYSWESENVLSYRIEEIGPWCLHWWDRFPSGFRADVEIGTRP